MSSQLKKLSEEHSLFNIKESCYLMMKVKRWKRNTKKKKDKDINMEAFSISLINSGKFWTPEGKGPIKSLSLVT